MADWSGDTAQEFLERLDRALFAEPTALAEARSRLSGRLQAWSGETIGVPLPRRKSKFAPGGDSGFWVDRHDEIELEIARALTPTKPTSQFGLTPKSEVFATSSYGWSQNARVYVTGLSPLLDEVAQVFWVISDGHGGRFYEEDGVFFSANGRQVIARLKNAGRR